MCGVLPLSEERAAHMHVDRQTNVNTSNDTHKHAHAHAHTIAGTALVNNLDLELRAAGLGGHKLLGNGLEDNANNVEAVRDELSGTGCMVGCRVVGCHPSLCH